ncbi:S24 family peptidase [Rhizobium leguminosarum]|uniref:S24 family peptidase n=1 Tax=Rhizobium leguminosarum TaxID=384 RepID=UPI00103F52A2|nr:S24 family peptidase [Rhizobium leguminosarum]TBZ07777.1 helix-turn-helix domain-containing protein [Rhizobium leguminosarum bv. viciae]
MTTRLRLGYKPQMTQIWKERLAKALEEKGLNMLTASRMAGKSDTYVRDLLKRDKEPTIENFINLAKVVGKPVSYLIGETDELKSIIPVMGLIGAGAEVMPDFEQVPPEGLDQIEVPFALPDEMIALEVRGSSMLPVYRDGTAIIVYRHQRKPLASFYGEDAAVRTSDGRRFLKTIMRGGADTVNLFSWNAAPIEGVRLEWIGEIFATIPKSSRN